MTTGGGQARGTRSTASTIPAGYGWPGPDAPTTEWRYWLTEQPDSGATQLYMVIADGRGEQHIAAERCYLSWGMTIVDALRTVAADGYHRRPLPSSP